MHSVGNQRNGPFGKICLVCFDQHIIDTVFPNNANKLFDICCKYLHSAIISETDKSTRESNLPFGKQNVTFCEKCMQSAVELSGLIEQLEYCQRSISEFIFVFSLRILHRRGKFNENRITKKIEEFDVSGLPDLDNDFESLADLALVPSCPFQSNDSQPIIICSNEVENSDINDSIEVETPEIVSGNEYFISNEITVGQVKIENQLHDDGDAEEFLENSFQCENIIASTSSCLTATNKRENKTIHLSKEQIANRPLPFVRLERLQVGKNLKPTGRKIFSHAKSNLKIGNVKSLQYQNPKTEISHDRRQQHVELLLNTNAVMPIKIETPSISEIVEREEVEQREVEKEVSDRKRYEGDEMDEAYDPKYDGVGYRFKCRVCKKRFRFKCVLLTHEKTHLEEKPFCCDVCNKVFKNKHTLLNHSRIHTGEKPFECSICKKRFTFQSGLFTHKFLHTGEKRFQCNLCKKRFTQKSALLSHYKVHTGDRKHYKQRAFKATPATNSEEKEFKCDVCNKMCASKQTLTIHQRVHSGEKPYSCSVCSKSFRQPSNLYTHMQIHTKPHQCEVCDKRFASKPSLETHMTKHTGERLMFQCDLCVKTLTSKQALLNHRRVHTKPHKCHVCHKRFSSELELNNHVSQHDDEKFQCKVCEKDFASKQTLIIHENIHTGEKPYQCSVCFKSFRQTSSLYTHMKVHTKPNKCSMCNKRFALKKSLENHMAKHKGEKRHKCNLCAYAAVNPHSVKIHILRKHSESKCQCRDCGKIFTTTDQVKGHYKRIHFAIDYTEDCVVKIA